MGMASVKASRQSQYRRRMRRGIVMVQVEIDAVVLNFLVETRWLSAADADDVKRCRKAAGNAISAMLKVSAKGR